MISNLAMVNHELPFGEVNIKGLTPARRLIKEKQKVVVVMGATGSGKSRLSIDLATHFANCEIINSDKIQLHDGLDIVTNKITPNEQRGVPHHLLGIASPFLDFSVAKFCRMATLAADSIVHRTHLPIIVGGSNSYVEALVDDYPTFRSKYECCFLWVDVSMPLLHSSVSDRVDKMVGNGLVEEVRNLFDPNNVDYSHGIRKAIGVPELDRYLRASNSDYEIREKLLQEAIAEIKANTCELACRQVDKILRLRNVKGWKIHRVDATEAFRKKGKEGDEAWTKLVAGPSALIVAHFLTQPHGQPYLKHKAFRMPFKRAPTAAATAAAAAR
ncbi:adenylate isopentenyltransferase 5, chloroplastic-like [Cucurbita moschata]|uniref:adenylate dimethylallyltransferase (ADP/ATP-dependent) n=1 Tax=Cucurbita moschata TaxID=3662 RepID=A0A6J1HJ23_CUCMO|nr:adenylate isopentenyltransferase 5, chloroplastic-like [Cucurbita moschata]